MADTHATGASTTVDDNLPAGITRKQDEIIQYVAKHVVASCDGARYQDKVRTRTRHNPYFDFLQAKHPYHTYYQYLLESYRHWMLNSAAVGTGAWGVALGDGQEQDAYGEQQQQQQWSEEDYYQYYGNYGGQAGGLGDGGVATDGGFGNGGATAAAPHDAHQQQASTQQPANGAVSSAAWAPETGYDPSAVGAEPPAVAAAEPEDADDEEYELVMEDGQWVSRKRT